MKRLLIFLLILAPFGFAACKKTNSSSSVVPEIRFMSMTPNHIKAASGEDTLFISFHLADGDADLGNDLQSANKDIYLIDSRDSFLQSFYFPSIPSQLKDASKGMEGTCTFFVNSVFISLRTDSIHTNFDTLQYEIFIRDRAGHESNHIRTPDIYLHN